MIGVVDYLKLFGGLVYLLVGGDLLVRGALGLSARSRVPPMVVGLTIVAIGTSAPELIVSIYAALAGHSAIAIGNVVGSNVANVFFVLGVPLLIGPMQVEDGAIRGHAAYMVGISALFVGLCWVGPLATPHGVLMLSVLAAGAVLTLRGHGTLPRLAGGEGEAELERGLGLPHESWSIWLLIGLGIVALPIGADLTVEGAEQVAGSLGVAEAAVAASAIAVGTSLPELSTTVIAAFHRSSGVALGNVIGSNVMNILAIMGITAVVSTVEVPRSFFRIDFWAMLTAAVVLWVVVVRHGRLGRTVGCAFLLAEAAYLVLIFRV